MTNAGSRQEASYRRRKMLDHRSLCPTREEVGTFPSRTVLNKIGDLPIGSGIAVDIGPLGQDQQMLKLKNVLIDNGSLVDIL